ncbi:PAS domain-containing sensor histidine kinase [Alicyclobacillaceae bacterium I2511]|nr:PAS domain-containing sensor histidine kinase [Alicyclobacillaceae bacterium I2511]
MVNPSVKSHASTQVASPIEMSSKLFQSIFDHSADGMVLMDSHRRILYMNRTAQQMTGLSQVLGAHCGTLFHCHDAHQQSLRSENCSGLCVLNEHVSKTNVEMNIVDHDGLIIPVSVTYSYIPGNSVEPYLLMSLRDISDKKRLEKENQEREALRYTLRERERLARDLHDTVAQDVAYANMQLKLMYEDAVTADSPLSKDLNRLSQVLDKTLGTLREAIYDLTFQVDEDLNGFLKKCIVEFTARTQMDIQYQTHHIPEHIKPHLTNQLAKIVQEALANIVKHSQAKHVRVSLIGQQSPHRLKLLIIDDGKGFDESAPLEGQHYGMNTMRERCTLIGGTLEISSSIGKGTRIKVELPLD